jgi:hypothetical protein
MEAFSLNKDSQVKLGAILFALVFLSLIVVAMDSNLNNAENQPVLNETSSLNANLTNNQFLNESTIIIEKNQSFNSIEEEKTTLPEKVDDFGGIILNNDDKFNDVTKSFFESVVDKSQERGFLIKYKLGFDKGKLEKFSGVKDFKNLRISKLTGTISDLTDVINDNSVELVELDQDLVLLGESVPFNVRQVNADSVWNLSTGSGVKVAVLDTGIVSHTDLVVAGGWNVVDDDSDYSDSDGHGTVVSGVIGSLLNDEGLVGVSPDVSLYSVKVMDGSTGSLSDAVAGVEWAMDNGMDIVSMSFGFDSYSEIFKDALNDAYDSGILLVGASGNDGAGNVLYPAAYSSVVAVGAVDEDNIRAGFSNYGFELELVAPGVDINSTSLGNGYFVASGTSLAVPHVAGVAALIWSYNQSLSNIQVRAKLRNDALDLGNPGKDDYYGYGLVRVNLSSENYNYSGLTYYYEVYNISDFGLDNESYAFWLSGNGTIDDVNFSEGYYLINKTINDSVISQKIFVDENGVMTILWDVIDVLDNWYGDGSSSDDWKIWEDSYYIKMKTKTSDHDVECWQYDYYETSDYDECYFRDSSAYAACGDDYCTGGVDCSIGSSYIGAYHYVVNGVSRRYKTAYVIMLDAGAYCTVDSGGIQNYYVFDQKRTVCDGSADYEYEGRSGTGVSDWQSYSSTFPCSAGSGCDTAQDEQACSTESCYPPSPCRRLDGYSCTNSSECFTNHSCIGGICGGSNQTVDLAIVNIIPIQVIPDVDMVKDKTGYIVVNVSNTGNLVANANVSAWFEGTKLNISTNSFGFTNDNPRVMDANSSALFIFDFKPWLSGTNKVINASVGVAS